MTQGYACGANRAIRWRPDFSGCVHGIRLALRSPEASPVDPIPRPQFGGYSRGHMNTALKFDPDRRRRLSAPVTATSIVVFTTIDGVLRHADNGSWSDASDGLNLLATRGIPVVLMSHGDCASVQDLQRELRLGEPFIGRGGASLYIPR